MLLFIQGSQDGEGAGDQFKYISCYCLSHYKNIPDGTQRAFKYISCYCLSQRRRVRRGGILIQIHLMLLFIKGWRKGRRLARPFKYISCYCLSMWRWTLPRRWWHSNTSHVIVYRRKVHHGCNVRVVFKYISCYCLSDPAPTTRRRCHGIQIHLMLLFIM